MYIPGYGRDTPMHTPGMGGIHPMYTRVWEVYTLMYTLWYTRVV